MKARLVPRQTCAAILVGILGAGFGCALLPKRLTYRRANVTAHGYRAQGFAGASFYRVDMGTPERPFRGAPALSLELPDGTTTRTDRLDVADLRARAERVTRDPQLWIEQCGWPAGIDEIAIGGYRFLVSAGEVVGVFVASRWNAEDVRPPPKIGDAEGRNFHALPLARRTLVALLGEPEALLEDPADLL